MTSSRPGALPYRPELDGLRAVAVALVMLFHARMPGFGGGFVGVDVFFVISGYLITRLLLARHQRGEASLLHFYERRARRLLPALAVVSAVTVFLGALVLVPRVFLGLGNDLTATALFAANLKHARAVGYFWPGAAESPLLHAWSLAVEEQFYLFFPPVLLLVTRRWPTRLRTLTWLGTLGSLALCVLLTQRSPTIGFYVMPSRAWEFGVGALVAMPGLPVIARAATRTAAASLGLLLVLASAFFLSGQEGFPGPLALPTVLGTALLIHADAAGPSAVGRQLSRPSLRLLGRMSYGLYLWHWPLLVLCQAGLWRGQPLPLWASLTVLLVSTALAAVSWFYLERPILRGGGGRRRVFGLSAAGVALAVVVGVGIRLGAGLPGRFAPDIQPIASAPADLAPIQTTCREDGRVAPCRHGASGAPVGWIVWGDSHAEALLPGLLAAVGPEVGVLSVTYRGCAPLLGVRRAALPEDKVQDCHHAQAAALALVAENPQATVLLHARWAAYAEGFLLQKGNVWRMIHEADGRPLTSFSLESTLAPLAELGARVVLVEGVPEFKVRVPEHLVASHQLGLPPVRLSRADHRARNRKVDAAFDEAARDPLVSVLPLSPLLCPDDCVMSRDGVSWYRDSNHLTGTAAREVVGPYLREALRGRSP